MQIDSLSTEEKARLLGGASTWRTHAIDHAGIPAIKMSDGPNGVRGDGLGARRTPGVVIPVGIAIGATWNPDLVGRLGDLLGKEAVRKGAHVLLAPTVNLQRTPIGGRVFECMSEDPELTARLAVPYVKGVQSHDVAVTVKHFAANDTEIDRMSVDARVDEMTLRELYLRPFEATVTEAGAWGIMSAYNQLNGEHCNENRWLLTTVLREEWGFDGFVVSDWFGFKDTVGSIDAGLTVAMPGPNTVYGDPLARAIATGDVDEAGLDRLLADLVRLVERTHADTLSSERTEETVDDPTERALCRQAAVEGAVLVRNEGALPLSTDLSVAVLGPNARDTRIMGGGSASLQAMSHRSFLDALGDRVASMTHEPGVRIDRLPPPLGRRSLRTPDGEPGLLVEYRNGTSGDGEIATTEITDSSMLRFFGSTPAGVDPMSFHLTLKGSFVPEISGPHTFSAVLTGAGRIQAGDVTVFDDPDRSTPRGPLFFGIGSEEQRAVIECEAGVPVELHITNNGRGGFSGIRLGVLMPEPPDMIGLAVEAARTADAAVVVVGTNDEWETEGEDRSTIALPGDQDELVRRVAEVNDRTIVVVNAGSPVSMPWIDDVEAVLVTYFGGQEMGEAVASVLLGETDPGGRLPITYPVALEDTPAWPHYAPVDGVQAYDEGLLMGYRGFDAAGTIPLFPFGHGLSYGDSAWAAPTTSTTSAEASVLLGGSAIDVTVPISATGDRDATVVVQVYLAPVRTVTGRPPKTLAAFTKTVVAAGTTDDVTVTVPGAAFRRWQDGAWFVAPGDYDLVVAASAGDERHRVRITVT